MLSKPVQISEEKWRFRALAKKLCFGGAMSMLFVLIAFGNIFRIISFDGHGDNILITEFLLYGFCFFSSFLLPLNIRNVIVLFFASFFILLSFFQGMIFQGFDMRAFSYAMRLILLIQACITLPSIFYERFKEDWVRLLAWVLKGYLVAGIISLLIFFLFRDSNSLWAFLKGFNIVFNGDPHFNRLVSVYLDPNFYAAIACIPFLLSLFLYFVKQKFVYLIYAVFFVSTIFLTNSRSGITLFILTAIACVLCFVLSLRYIRINKRSVFIFLFILCAGGCFLVANDSIGVFFERMLSIKSDPSALFRLDSFRNGMDVILEHPVLGIGYNYLKNEAFIDSSILIFAGCFGVLPCLIAVGAFGLSMLSLFFRISGKEDVNFVRFVRVFVLYVFFSVFFYSFFNNLLFYPFWLIPVLSILNYISLINKKTSLGQMLAQQSR